MKNIIFVIIALLMFSCKDDTPSLNGDTGSMAFNAISVPDITYKSATVKAEVSNSPANLLKTGFCYGTEASPEINSSLVETNISEGVMQAELSSLSESTTYYVRAFAMAYDGKVVYSDEASFTTGSPDAEQRLADYVAPTYDDDYTNISSWNQRSRWNLANVHDPSVVKADDGYYYMYQTDASYGNAHAAHGHFHCRRSKDLVNWEYMGATMPSTPDWILEELNKTRAEMGLEPITSPQYGYWAPVVRKVREGLYRMYYSIVIDNYIKTGKPAVTINNVAVNFDNSWTERAYIGLMETSDPASNIWEDKGMVVCSSTDKNMGDWGRSGLGDWQAYFYFNAIDPTYVITESGEHWMIYGSWHSGFAAVEIDPATGKTKTDLSKPWNILSNGSTYGKLVARKDRSRWQGSEGPDIIYNPETEYYYMFIAYGQLAVSYNTRVVRSKYPDRDFKDMRGVAATSGDQAWPIVTHPYQFNDSYGWVGISHCGIFSDGAGNWFYTSQARFPVDIPGINQSNAVMMGHVRSIRWTEGETDSKMDGWPIVMPERYGAVPQDLPISKDELTGNWELIIFSGKPTGSDATTEIKKSQILTLNQDGTVETGVSEWTGKQWTYDAAKKVITINETRIYLQREVDWEATPRVHTVVGGGYGTSSEGIATYWLKKLK